MKKAAAQLRMGHLKLNNSDILSGRKMHLAHGHHGIHGNEYRELETEFYGQRHSRAC
jgi:hypothetical protein